MQRPHFIAEQSRLPQGWLGKLVGRIMGHETAEQNRRALKALAIEPRHSLLELGFAHGRTIKAMATAAPQGHVAGIDHSTEMLEAARTLCAPLLDSGRVDLRVGDSKNIPYADAAFDGVLGVHILYFWEDPLAHLAEVRRVLKPRGSLVLGFRDRRDPASADFPPPTYRFWTNDEVLVFLHDAGFDAIETLESEFSFTLLRARVAG